jgi:prostaglandin-endoperoxide synthase 2
MTKQAVLLSDRAKGKPLPAGSLNYEDHSSNMTRFTSNVKNKAISTLLKVPVVGKQLNRIATNKAASSGTNRPYNLSCKSDYTSYESLTDYTYYGRHLPSADQEWLDNLPPIEKVAELFKRKKDANNNEEQTMCIKSTMLFPTFAQHLIDSFIDTVYHYDDDGNVCFEWEKTGTPHDIGLLTLYGKTIPETRQLRKQSETSGEKGKLKSQLVNGEEWAPFLYDSNGKVKEEFNKLPVPQGIDGKMYAARPELQASLKKSIFAFGGSRTNLTPNISAWNTLLLREHNRIAGLVEEENPTWDDERVFQTARNCTLVIYLRLVIEEYINHITAYGVDFEVEPEKWMWDSPWYKRNWISAEFAVLYRWHAVIPSLMKWGEKTHTTMEYLFSNNLLLSDDGMKGNLRECFHNICDHRATSMQLHNSEGGFMVGRDKSALEMSRSCKLRSFVEYCGYLGSDEPETFADITQDKDLQKELKDVYGEVKNVEFWTGLIAKDHSCEAIMSGELTKFVANDAFNQALTHPLLSEHVFNATVGEKVFSKVGYALCCEVPSIAAILKRNSEGGAEFDKAKPAITMTDPEYDIPLSKVTKQILQAIFVVLLAIVAALFLK